MDPKPTPRIEPVFFDSQARFRRWLERNHASAPELWVGFWKAHTGRGGLTYEQALDEALCFGWIDGLVRRVDDEAYMQRFTPRKPTSTWSAVNIAKVEALEKAGRMAAPGRDAFRKRDPRRAGRYSFENRDVTFAPELEKRFRHEKAAWKFFEAQPPGYRRMAAFWVMSAKREETRERRLGQLIDGSRAGVRLPALSGQTAPRKSAA